MSVSEDAPRPADDHWRSENYARLAAASSPLTRRPAPSPGRAVPAYEEAARIAREAIERLEAKPA